MCTSMLWPIALTIPNGSSIGSSVFARPMPYNYPYTYTLSRRISPKICHLPLWIRTQPIKMIHRFLGALGIAVQSATSAVFPKYTLVINRRTDRQTERRRILTYKNRPLMLKWKDRQLTQHRLFTRCVGYANTIDFTRFDHREFWPEEI